MKLVYTYMLFCLAGLAGITILLACLGAIPAALGAGMITGLLALTLSAWDEMKEE